jgi:Fur family transcriptional regulator, ferric uptake regulator
MERNQPTHATRSRVDLEAYEAAEQVLRRAGCRPSPQRLLVIEALTRGDHLSATEVLDAVRLIYPTASASTVYRTLDALTSAGLIRANDLGLGRTHYELAAHHLHHHAVCVDCQTVIHLHDGAIRALADALGSHGFHLTDDRELTFPGRCDACQSAPAQATTAPSPAIQYPHAHGASHASI